MYCLNSSALYHYKQSIDNNRAKPPSDDEVNKWIAHALVAITPHR